MPIIHLETTILATPAVCYQLALSVDLHQSSTSGTQEYIVGGVNEGKMQLNDTVTWRAKHFGIWQNLTVKITACTPFEYFRDEMQKGAFKSMQHEHYFIETPAGTLMKDVFNFESPLGILGRIFNALILTNYMTKFLITRNQFIKSVAESDAKNEFID